MADVYQKLSRSFSERLSPSANWTAASLASDAVVGDHDGNPHLSIAAAGSRTRPGARNHPSRCQYDLITLIAIGSARHVKRLPRGRIST